MAHSSSSHGERELPHSLEAEQSVLGGLLRDNRAWDQVVDHLQDSDFFRREHRLIFQAITSLAEEDAPFDVITVGQRLEDRHKLADVGGLSYLGNLFDNTPSAANIRFYVQFVRDKSIRRAIIAVATEIIECSFSADKMSCDALLDMAEQKILSIAEKKMRVLDGFEHVEKIMSRTMARIDELYRSKNPITGVATGWTDLDQKTAGLQRGDLIIIAGRPSMGKTSLAMNIVEHVALSSQQAVAVFSMEMPADMLAMRMLSSRGRVDQMRVRTGQLTDEDFCTLTTAMLELNKGRLFVDDSSNLGPHELRSRARRLHKQEGGLALVVIDYLQLMQIQGSSENRATEVSEISRALKGLAKELQVPVVALSQLNRTVEHRSDKRPMMSDLRESGAIEQDADLICFIYRDEVYNPQSPDSGVAEVIIGKQRNGPLGTVRLAFLGQYTRFENYLADNGLPAPTSMPFSPRSP